jgi:hypothetical protein
MYPIRMRFVVCDSTPETIADQSVEATVVFHLADGQTWWWRPER